MSCGQITSFSIRLESETLSESTHHIHIQCYKWLTPFHFLLRQNFVVLFGEHAALSAPSSFWSSLVFSYPFFSLEEYTLSSIRRIYTDPLRVCLLNDGIAHTEVVCMSVSFPSLSCPSPLTYCSVVVICYLWCFGMHMTFISTLIFLHSDGQTAKDELVERCLYVFNWIVLGTCLGSQHALLMKDWSCGFWIDLRAWVLGSFARNRCVILKKTWPAPCVSIS